MSQDNKTSTKSLQIVLEGRQAPYADEAYDLVLALDGDRAIFRLIDAKSRKYSVRGLTLDDAVELAGFVLAFAEAGGSTDIDAKLQAARAKGHKMASDAFAAKFPTVTKPPPSPSSGGEG